MGYVMGFEQIDRTNVADVGGKGAGLGELSRIDGVRVPDGFCVTTDAYRRIVALASRIDDQFDLLSNVEPGDRKAIAELSARIRRTIEVVALPDDLTAAINGSLAAHDARTAWAVRSSATAEDLPTASFAGQQDSYLNVLGAASVLRHKIQALSGLALLDFILADFTELKRILFDPRSSQVIMAGFEATWWLNEHLET